MLKQKSLIFVLSFILLTLTFRHPVRAQDTIVFELLELLNEARNAQNIHSLTLNSLLTMAARQHSNDMAQSNFLNHTGSDGSSADQRITQVGYLRSASAENILYRYDLNVQETLNQWMNSPGHKTNMMNDVYCDIGLAYAQSGDRYYWTITLGVKQGQNCRDVSLPTIVLPGTFQTVLGCDSDWDPTCNNTSLTFDSGSGLWLKTFNLPAGDYEYKVAINGTWDENYGANAEPGGANIPMSLMQNSEVQFSYDPITHMIVHRFIDLSVNAPGDYQSEIGCPTSEGITGDWNPACIESQMQDADGDGVYQFRANLIPAGSYEVKVAMDGSWDWNYGLNGEPNGANIPFDVSQNGATVVFSFDTATNLLTVSTLSTEPIQFDLPSNLADDAWVDSGIVVVKGQKFVLTTSGNIDIYPDCENSNQTGLPCNTMRFGPEGSEGIGPATNEYPLPGELVGAVIARISHHGTPFLVGEGKEFIALGDGNLQVRLNDFYLEDNIGNFTITFQLLN
jgi:hypothetical protein